jgi:hypothetical protein
MLCVQGILVRKGNFYSLSEKGIKASKALEAYLRAVGGRVEISRL